MPAHPASTKTLDAKLARILADPGCRDFILADAKDADMAFGLAAAGVRPGGDLARGPYRSIDDYRDQIRVLVAQGLVDIMLMSASTSERLAIDEGLFASSTVTPAVRMNDTTDIWLAAGTGGYPGEPALPFATTTIPQARCGRVSCGTEAGRGVDLGLFSITLNNDANLDRAMLAAYREFRLDAERAGFRHFLEVFFPNAAGRIPGRPAPPDMARFLADHVVRALAGVPRAGRPIFLKIPYLGPVVTEQLAAYDRSLIVGVLGGGGGPPRTTPSRWSPRRSGTEPAWRSWDARSTPPRISRRSSAFSGPSRTTRFRRPRPSAPIMRPSARSRLHRGGPWTTISYGQRRLPPTAAEQRGWIPREAPQETSG